MKTPAQAAKWGGTAGAPFDACYHLACDTTRNVSNTALEQNADAVAYAVAGFARSTEAVNGRGVAGAQSRRTVSDAQIRAFSDAEVR